MTDDFNELKKYLDSPSISEEGIDKIREYSKTVPEPYAEIIDRLLLEVINDRGEAERLGRKLETICFRK